MLKLTTIFVCIQIHLRIVVFYKTPLLWSTSSIKFSFSHIFIFSICSLWHLHCISFVNINFIDGFFERAGKRIRAVYFDAISGTCLLEKIDMNATLSHKSSKLIIYVLTLWRSLLSASFVIMEMSNFMKKAFSLKSLTF